MFGAYNSLYSIAHWVFAFHYYSSAVCLDEETPSFCKLKFFFWSMVVLNLILPFWEDGIYFFPDASIKGSYTISIKLRLMGYSSTILLQLISTVLTTFSLLKIKKAISKQRGLDIHLQTLFLHQAAFYIYLVSLVMYMCYIWKALITGPFMFPLYLREVRLVSSFISQMFLIYVFNKVCNLVGYQNTHSGSTGIVD